MTDDREEIENEISMNYNDPFLKQLDKVKELLKSKDQEITRLTAELEAEKNRRVETASVPMLEKEDMDYVENTLKKYDIPKAVLNALQRLRFGYSQKDKILVNLIDVKKELTQAQERIKELESNYKDC